MSVCDPGVYEGPFGIFSTLPVVSLLAPLSRTRGKRRWTQPLYLFSTPIRPCCISFMEAYAFRMLRLHLLTLFLCSTRPPRPRYPFYPCPSEPDIPGYTNRHIPFLEPQLRV